MPPRYAYWTILVDDQPTAFRAATQDDLMPTYKRLKEKNASAKMMWWQNGKLWPSRLDAQDAMRARGEMGRRGDARQGGGFRDRNKDREQRPERDATGKLAWKPKGEAGDRPAPRARNDGPLRRERSDRPEWNSKDTRRSSASHIKSTFPPRRDAREKLEWQPRGAGAPRAPKKEWAAKTTRPNSRPRRDDKLEWKPKGAGEAPKRKWVPKEEYKKSQSSGPQALKPSGPGKRDKTWRPGGEHKDPRQKYKDAKKAKWTRFKQNIRSRWEAKQPGGRKRRDEE